MLLPGAVLDAEVYEVDDPMLLSDARVVNMGCKEGKKDGPRGAAPVGVSDVPLLVLVAPVPVLPGPFGDGDEDETATTDSDVGARPRARARRTGVDDREDDREDDRGGADATNDDEDEEDVDSSSAAAPPPEERRPRGGIRGEGAALGVGLVPWLCFRRRKKEGGAVSAGWRLGIAFLADWNPGRCSEGTFRIICLSYEMQLLLF